jgi:hypothetical protein
MYLVRSFIAVVFATIILCPIELLVSERYLSLYVEYSTPWIALNTWVSFCFFCICGLSNAKALNGLVLLILWAWGYLTAISFVTDLRGSVVFEPIISGYDSMKLCFFIFGVGIIIISIYFFISLYFLKDVDEEE